MQATKARYTREYLVSIATGEWKSLQAIGQILGVTGERARQILNKQGVVRTRRPNHQLCLQCGRWIGTTKTQICWTCNPPYSALICTQCGKEFQRLNSYISARNKNAYSYYKTNNVFCGRQCFGAYAGTHYGWPIHRNQRRNQGVSHLLCT